MRILLCIKSSHSPTKLDNWIKQKNEGKFHCLRLEKKRSMKQGQPKSHYNTNRSSWKIRVVFFFFVSHFFTTQLKQHAQAKSENLSTIFQVKMNKKWTNPLSDYLHKAFPQCTTQLSGWKELIGTHQLIHQRNKAFCAQTTSKGNTCMVSAFHGDLSDQGWEFKNLPDLPRHLVILRCITNHLLQCSLSDWWFLASIMAIQPTPPNVPPSEIRV